MRQGMRRSDSDCVREEGGRAREGEGVSNRKEVFSA